MCDVYHLTDEKQQFQEALDEVEANYGDLDEEHKTVVKQLEDADKQLRNDLLHISPHIRIKKGCRRS